MLRNVPFLEPELGGDFNISGWVSPGLYLAPLHERQPVAMRDLAPVLVASSISAPVAPVVALATVNPLQQNALMPLLLLGAAALLLIKA